MEAWHAINDTYKKVALNSKEKRCERYQTLTTAVETLCYERNHFFLCIYDKLLNE
jgi:hypothetical protein